MKNKKLIIGIVIGIIAVLAAVIISLLQSNEPQIAFYIKNGKAKECRETISYGKTVSLKPTSFHLTAKEGNTDITDKLIYTKVNFKQLRTYKITYSYKEKRFYRYITVEDKKAPVITGKNTLEIEQGSSFDMKQLELKAEDNYDGDMSDQIKQEGTVDSNTPGDYELTYTVKDSSGNQAVFTVKVTVLKKEAVQAPSVSHVQVRVVADPNDITALVNKQNILPDGWAPSDLVTIQNGFLLRAVAAQAWNAMMNAAAQDGITINAVSAYRTQAYQANLYNQYYAADPVNTPFLSALPRRSEHEMGLALDISNSDYQLHSDFESTASGKWLSAHAHEYGWILRYPSNKTNITQYAYEAWHYRYVGPGLAKQLKSSGQTLEEYYQ